MLQRNVLDLEQAKESLPGSIVGCLPLCLGLLVALRRPAGVLYIDGEKMNPF